MIKKHKKLFENFILNFRTIVHLIILSKIISLINLKFGYDTNVISDYINYIK